MYKLLPVVLCLVLLAACGKSPYQEGYALGKKIKKAMSDTSKSDKADSDGTKIPDGAEFAKKMKLFSPEFKAAKKKYKNDKIAMKQFLKGFRNGLGFKNVNGWDW